MSEHTESNNPVTSVLGSVVLFAAAFSMIAMLGFVGVAFIGGLGEKKKPEQAQAAVSPAPAPAPAPTGGEPAAAPAAVEAPATAPSEGGNGIDPAVMALGKTTYAQCAACHGPNGEGLQVGPTKMAPSMIGSELLLGDPDAPLLVVHKGILKENMDFMGAMLPLGATLDDEKIAAVLTFLRNSWGNSAPPVTVEQAASARAKFAPIEATGGVKRTEIMKVVGEHK